MSTDAQALLKALAGALGVEGPAEVAEPRFRPTAAGSPITAAPQIRTVMLADGTTVTGTVVAKPRVTCERCGRTFAEASSGIERHNLPSGLDPDRSTPTRTPCTDDTAPEYRAWVAAQK